MKKIKWSLLAYPLLGAVITIVIMLIFLPSKPKEFDGIILQSNKSFMIWDKVKNYPESYQGIACIQVFSPELGTVTAIIPDKYDMNADTWFDINFITYPDTYPPAIGKSIHVKMRYIDDKLMITKAWAE